MLALLVATLVASLLGSAHCAGMCGAFLAIAVGTGRDDARERRVLQACYHAGRLGTYVLLGALAGGVGRALDGAGALLGVQKIAAGAAGACMVVFGLVMLLRVLGVRAGATRRWLPPGVQGLMLRAHRAIGEWSPARRALATGLLTTLLPCGWLYAFAIIAAGTGSAPWGALVMASFWLGTLPVLVALGAGVQRLSGPLRARLPVVTSVLVIGMGVLSALGRVTLPVGAMMGAVGPVPGSAGEALARAQKLDASAMPCCNPESDGANNAQPGLGGSGGTP